MDPRGQQVWDVIEGFVNVCGSQVRFRRDRLGQSAYEAASIAPVATGAAFVQVVVGEGEVIVSIGAGGRYELGFDAEDVRILAALLQGVAAGGYVEDVGRGVRHQTTLADGSIMIGTQLALSWPPRWRRRRLTYEPYRPPAAGGAQARS